MIKQHGKPRNQIQLHEFENHLAETQARLDADPDALTESLENWFRSNKEPEIAVLPLARSFRFQILSQTTLLTLQCFLPSLKMRLTARSLAVIVQRSSPSLSLSKHSTFRRWLYLCTL